MNENVDYKTWIIRFFSIVLLFATTAIVNAKVNQSENDDSRIVASQIFQEEADTNGNAIPVSDPMIYERSILLEFNSLKKIVGYGFEKGYRLEKDQKIKTFFGSNFKPDKNLNLEKYIVYCCLKLSDTTGESHA